MQAQTVMSVCPGNDGKMDTTLNGILVPVPKTVLFVSQRSQWLHFLEFETENMRGSPKKLSIDDAASYAWHGMVPAAST